MNELQVFDFKGTNVTTIEFDNEVWFLGNNIAEALGYTNASKAITDHVDDDDSRVLMYGAYNETLKPKNTLWKGSDYSSKTIINESGMYSLVLGSKLPSAKAFKRWVTSEVLPSIRKTGSYTQRPMTTQEQVSLALKGWQEHNERFIAVETEIEDIKDNMGLPANMAETLTIARRKQVITILGGKNAPAYKQLSKNVFAEFGRDFKQYFELPRYDSLAMRRFDEAIDYTHHWQPSINMTLLIRQLNSQTALAV